MRAARADGGCDAPSSPAIRSRALLGHPVLGRGVTLSFAARFIRKAARPPGRHAGLSMAARAFHRSFRSDARTPVYQQSTRWFHILL